MNGIQADWKRVDVMRAVCQYACMYAEGLIRSGETVGEIHKKAKQKELLRTDIYKLGSRGRCITFQPLVFMPA
jgi:hypothetical protein